MQKADLIRQIELKFAALDPVFDERVRRQWAAAEAMAYGWGGVTAVSRATGLSIDTIRKVISRQKRERGIPTAMRSSSISIRQSSGLRSKDSR